MQKDDTYWKERKGVWHEVSKERPRGEDRRSTKEAHGKTEGGQEDLYNRSLERQFQDRTSPCMARTGRVQRGQERQQLLDRASTQDVPGETAAGQEEYH